MILDLAELTREQQEFLEKFFKDNPWMENVSIDVIGKQTGLPESMIKVRSIISIHSHFHSSSSSAGLSRTTSIESIFIIELSQLHLQ